MRAGYSDNEGWALKRRPHPLPHHCCKGIHPRSILPASIHPGPSPPPPPPSCPLRHQHAPHSPSPVSFRAHGLHLIQVQVACEILGLLREHAVCSPRGPRSHPGPGVTNAQGMAWDGIRIQGLRSRMRIPWISMSVCHRQQIHQDLSSQVTPGSTRISAARSHLDPPGS